MNDYQLEKLESFVDKIMSKLKGFKTLIWTVAVGLLSLLETTDLTNIVSKENMPYVILAIGAGNLIMRAISNTRIGKSS